MNVIGDPIQPSALTNGLQGIAIDRSQPIVPQIYDQLRRRIIDNRLPPGSEISEAAVAKHCNVSRTPLRAAMQQLAGEGLILTRPQVGSFVAPLDQSRLQEALFIRSAVEEAIVRKLADSGIAATTFAPILAAQKAAAEHDDHIGFFRFDEEFHALLAALAEVPNSWKLVQGFKAHVDRQRLALTSAIEGRAMRAYSEHCAILDAISARDANAAVTAMRGHIASVLKTEPPPNDEDDKTQN